MTVFCLTWVSWIIQNYWPFLHCVSELQSIFCTLSLDKSTSYTILSYKQLCLFAVSVSPTFSPGNFLHLFLEVLPVVLCLLPQVCLNEQHLWRGRSSGIVTFTAALKKGNTLYCVSSFSSSSSCWKYNYLFQLVFVFPLLRIISIFILL